MQGRMRQFGIGVGVCLSVGRDAVALSYGCVTFAVARVYLMALGLRRDRCLARVAVSAPLAHDRAVTRTGQLPSMIAVPRAGLFWATAITSKAARSPTSSRVSLCPISMPASVGTRGCSGDPQTVASVKRCCGRSPSAPGSSLSRTRRGRGRITFAVVGLDGLLERLAARGIEHEPIETYSNGVRHVDVPDPDGNAIAFAEPPDAAGA